MTFTSDQVMAGCAVVTIIGGIIAFMLAQKDNAQQEQLDGMKKSLQVEIERVKENAKQQDAATRTEICQNEKLHAIEISRLSDSLKAAWVMIDRLKEDRQQFWTREEHEKWRLEVRKELKDDIHDMSNRLSEKLGQVSEKFGEKIAEIMKNCADCGNRE